MTWLASAYPAIHAVVRVPFGWTSMADTSGTTGAMTSISWSRVTTAAVAERPKLAMNVREN
jgi:hypothetical protein